SAVITNNFIGTDSTGTTAAGNFEGITLFGAYAVITNNVISGNSDDGVRVRADFARIQGNFVGTDLTGSVGVPNFAGIFVTAGGTLIGGGPASRNVISGNIMHGVYFSAAVAGGNFVQGNYIGTDVTGQHQLGNGGNGVFVNASSDVQIGGVLAGQG